MTTSLSSKDGYEVHLATLSGEIHPLAPQPSEINLVDIARSLAHTARWRGHTCGLFTVAEHSIMVSKACPEEFALWGLIHDAAEAYLMDVPGPFKHMVYFEVPTETGVDRLPFSQVEETILNLVLEELGLPKGPMPLEVHAADMAVRRWEWENVRDCDPPDFTKAKHVPMAPDVAMHAWLDRLNALTVGIGW